MIKTCEFDREILPSRCDILEVVYVCSLAPRFGFKWDAFLSFNRVVNNSIIFRIREIKEETLSVIVRRLKWESRRTFHLNIIVVVHSASFNWAGLVFETGNFLSQTWKVIRTDRTLWWWNNFNHMNKTFLGFIKPLLGRERKESALLSVVFCLVSFWINAFSIGYLIGFTTRAELIYCTLISIQILTHKQRVKTAENKHGEIGIVR